MQCEYRVDSDWITRTITIDILINNREDQLVISILQCVTWLKSIERRRRRRLGWVIVDLVRVVEGTRDRY